MNLNFKSITLCERTVHTMLGTLSVLVLLYCVVLLSLVFSVIERKQNTIASRDLTSQLSSLETKYANKIASIDDSVLAANKYSRVDNTTFAVRKDDIASYTVLYAR
jgi:hypothetical protein